MNNYRNQAQVTNLVYVLEVNAPKPWERETQILNVGKGVGNEVLQQAHITKAILV